MERYLIGILGIVGLMLAWLVVQRLWRKIFAEHVIDGDVLAGRSDCGGGCGCTTSCQVKQIKKIKDK